MKHTSLFKLWAVLLMTGLSFSFVACGDEEEEIGPNIPGAKEISTDEDKNGFYDGTFYYRIGNMDSHTLIVSGPSKSLSGSPTVPTYVKLTSANLPKELRTTYTVTYIGDWSLIDSSIKTIYFPETLTKIGKDAFFRCTNLTKITLPSAIKEIGDNAFLSCNNLKTVYCYALTPPVNDDAFSYYTTSGGTLHVPAASLSLYKSNSQWNDFSVIVGDL